MEDSIKLKQTHVSLFWPLSYDVCDVSHVTGARQPKSRENCINSLVACRQRAQKFDSHNNKRSDTARERNEEILLLEADESRGCF